jgi:hypothetical protein
MSGRAQFARGRDERVFLLILDHTPLVFDGKMQTYVRAAGKNRGARNVAKRTMAFTRPFLTFWELSIVACRRCAIS